MLYTGRAQGKLDLQDMTSEVGLSGSAGPGGVDSVDLQNWLLRFGKESLALREEIAEWASWLANDSPPWAAYQAVMASRLIAMDKRPGVRPVDMGELLRRLLAKVILHAVGPEATTACDNRNLCAGLKAGIEGAVHALRDGWASNLADSNGDCPGLEPRSSYYPDAPQSVHPSGSPRSAQRHPDAAGGLLP
jgi:hypothetical protein